MSDRTKKMEGKGEKNRKEGQGKGTDNNVWPSTSLESANLHDVETY